MEPEKVPEKLENPIDFKILLLILAAGIGVYFTLGNLAEDDAGSLAFILSVTIAFAVSGVSFIVAKRYWHTHVFGRAYLSLGLGFLSYAVAEILYYTFELILGIPGYPSIADIFFFALYPFVLIHLILNIRFFIKQFSRRSKFWIPLIPVGFVVTYAYTALVELGEPNFDFYYGIIFICGASITLSFAILGASIFRKGVLGVAWLLLVIGILTNALGDLWYYYLELAGAYYDAHPVTVVWYVSNLIMVYALYKHQKII